MASTILMPSGVVTMGDHPGGLGTHDEAREMRLRPPAHRQIVVREYNPEARFR